MKSRSYLLNAFIIKRKNYGEADKIITVFSKEKGKQTLIAKGIRRIYSKRSGNLELFNQVQIMVVKGRGEMDIMTEVSLTNCYSNYCIDYQKTKLAYQIAELIDKFANFEESNFQLYNLIEKAFSFIKISEIDSQKAVKTIARFKMRLLEILGFGLPYYSDNESLSIFIEELLEKKLVANGHFEI